MTVEMWMGLGIIVAIVGFVLWKTALNLRAKGNRNAGMFSTIAWLLIMVGVMITFSFFRVKYLSWYQDVSNFNSKGFIAREGKVL